MVLTPIPQGVYFRIEISYVPEIGDNNECCCQGSEHRRVHRRVKFVKLNIDDNRDIAIKYGVMSIPTIAKFERGSLTAQVVGARGADQLVRELGLEG
jgi:hypothetical protein